MTGLRYDGQDWPFPTTPPALAYSQFEEQGQDGYTVTYRHFDSVQDYCDLTVHPKNVGKDDSEGWGGSMRWFGCEGGRTEALKISKQGHWPEGQRRMDEALAGFDIPKPRSIKRKAVWSDEGDFLDIHKVYAGQLDQAWRRTPRHPRPASQSLVISLPLMIASMDNSDKLFWCGAAALKLTDLLTEAGYNVSLIGIEAGKWYRHRRVAYTTLYVKKPNEPLDVEALTVTVAFPGFARTVGFKAIASFPWDVESSLGELVEDEEYPLRQMGLPASSVLGGLYRSVRDQDSARQWIVQQLNLIEQTHLEAS